MSDIQSISQGNYILQGTVATSAGIVGDGSTQNPLRADETVLYSGDEPTSAFNTSESVSNFEKYKIRDFRGQYFEFDSNDKNPCFSNISYYKTNRYIRLGGFIINGTSFTNEYGSELTINSAGNVTLDNNFNRMINGITQVIGINRKNNA